MAPDLTNGASRHVEKQDEVSLRPTFKPSCSISHAEHCGPSQLVAKRMVFTKSPLARYKIRHPHEFPGTLPDFQVLKPMRACHCPSLSA